MLKIMLVDDEVNIVEGLDASIDWKKYGYCVVGKAYNGKEALSKALESRPDVILTDITMPVMDGMELVEKVRVYLPDIRVIFLTCHEDFYFARQAVKLNVSEYLTKETMTREELYPVLKNISEQINNERIQKEKELSMVWELNKSRYYIGESIINEILQGDIKDMTEMTNRLQLYRYSFKYESFMLSILEIDRYEKLTEESEYKNKNLIKFVILNILEELLDKYDIGKVFSKSDKEFIIIYNFNPNLKVSIFDRIKQISAEIQMNFRKILGGTCTVYIGSRFGSIVQAKDAYNEAKTLERPRFYMADEALVTFADRKEGTEGNTEYLKEAAGKLEESLHGFDAGDSVAIIRDMINKSRENRSDTSSVKYAAERIVAVTNGFLEKYCDIYNQSMLNTYIQRIRDARSIFTVDDTLTECVRSTFEIVKKTSAIHSNAEILKVLQYVDKHFQENITLESMANYVSLNSSYFSRLFKNKIGENFIDYLAKYRIEKAKELLLKANLSIDEIAEKVGHINSAYFMKVFKKLTGITPGEYRRAQCKR